jgi:uncharacterized protein (TIGR02453 family)
MNAKPLLNFLKKLKKNNNKEWFDKNRPEYEALRKEFASTITELIAEIGKFEPEVRSLEPKNVMFRINKDIRFSKDKTPYKTNFGASISPGGKKTGKGGYYFHVEPGEIFLAGGIYMPEPPILKNIRQEIDYNAADFRKILKNKDFKNYFGDFWDEGKLVRPPKGYDENHPEIEYLKMKHFIVVHALTEKDLESSSFIKHAGKVFKALQPVNQFLNRAFDQE